MENETGYLFKFLFGSLLLLYMINTVILYGLNELFGGDFVKILCGGLLIIFTFAFVVTYWLTSPKTMMKEEE